MKHLERAFVSPRSGRVLPPDITFTELLADWRSLGELGGKVPGTEIVNCWGTNVRPTIKPVRPLLGAAKAAFDVMCGTAAGLPNKH